MKVAVVGATGLVGSKVLQVLAERNFPVTEIIPVASERSVGKEIDFKGKRYKVVGMEDGIAAKPALAIFSAGGGTSLEWAPKFAEAGITVIDNSSSWRMDPTKKLVVPEINADVTPANFPRPDLAMNDWVPNTIAYDAVKVAAVRNEVDGLDSSGHTQVGVPAIFGMNFQAVSVAEKLVDPVKSCVRNTKGGCDPNYVAGGYVNSGVRLNK